jgi:ClpA/ClpB-like protein
MFERYTEGARRVIFFARYEASQYGSRIIEPEHMLLGLLRERPSLLEGRLSLNPVTNLRPEIEPQLRRGPRFTTSVEVPLSEESKHVLGHASAEAERLSHPQIGTEHILFGILAEQKCPASQVLRAHGLNVFVPHEERPRRRTEELDAMVMASAMEPFTSVTSAEVASPNPPEWQQEGIPPGYGFSQLLYNPSSGIQIVELCHGASERFHPNRLFVRLKGAERYEQLGTPEESCSQESAVTSPGQPILFFNSNRLTIHGDRVSGDWDGLYSVDLEKLVIVRCTSKETLQLPAPYNDCWVTNLLSLSVDGKLLYLTIGMCQMAGSTRQEIAYFLAQFDVVTGNLETISRLRATFF